MDLREIFEGWLRSRVAGERPGFAPGSVTEGGYEMDTEGMQRWVADTAEFVLWLAANEPEMFGEFRFRYEELDPEGWDALVGFGGGFHDKPAGPPDESQLDSDVEVLVVTPVDVIPELPTTTTTAPPVSTTTIPLPTAPPPTVPPPTTTTTTTTAPPPTTSVDPPPTTSVDPPPTTTRPGIMPPHPLPEVPSQDLPTTTTRPEWEGAHWDQTPAPTRVPPRGPETRPHSADAPFWPRVPADWPYASRDERRRAYEESGAGEDDLTLNMGDDTWGAPPGTPASPPPGVAGFIGVYLSALFDLEAAPTVVGAEDPRPSASLSGGQNPSFWADRVVSDQYWINESNAAQ